MKKGFVLLIAVLLNGSLTIAQVQQKMYNASLRAYKNKDYKSFLEIGQKLDTVRPNHPTYTYNLASAYALNNEPEKAVATLKRLVMLDNTAAFESDEDFKEIKDREDFKALSALKTTQNKVEISSKPLVTLSEKDLHPEGFTYLSKAKLWLATSVRKRKIVSFDIKKGKCKDWFKDEKNLAILALKADAKEEFLWVATAAMPQMDNFSKEKNGMSEVLKIDIKTKKVVNGFSVKGIHVFGDLIVAKNGAVYVSDSNKAVLYKIQNDKIEEFMLFEKEGYNLQGLAFNKDESKIFLADYFRGIFVIDIATQTKKMLSIPEGATPKGIDGLVFYDNSLIGIQNGAKPIRITQFQLNEKQDQITGFKILDNNRPEFNEPALATVVGNTLYFFANSPWNAYDDKGVLDETKVSNPVIYTYKLD